MHKYEENKTLGEQVGNKFETAYELLDSSLLLIKTSQSKQFNHYFNHFKITRFQVKIQIQIND